MSVREQAVLDIMEDLRKEYKSFLAFRKELNPVMRTLVRQQLREQSTITPFLPPSHSNSQLVAHCFFSKGKVHYENYDRYYGKSL